MSYTFIPGLELNRKFFKLVVEELIEKKYPKLKYSCGLIGYGSDALGTDTAISMDHEWGPRLYLFLEENDIYLKKEIDAYLSKNLPLDFMGFPTNYIGTVNDGIRRMDSIVEGPVFHHIDITSFETFLQNVLGSSGEIEKFSDYFAYTEQALLEVTNGELFRDDLDIESKRKKYKSIPTDVTRMKLASLWNLISSEEAFFGRNFDLGDLIGGKIIALRNLNHLMKICFCLENKFIPYSKWLSALFWKLDISSKLETLFHTIVVSNNGFEISNALVKAYSIVLEEQNKKKLTKKINLPIKDYYGRPYNVIFTENIVAELIENITDTSVKNLDLSLISLLVSNNGLDLTDTLHVSRKFVELNKI